MRSSIMRPPRSGPTPRHMATPFRILVGVKRVVDYAVRIRVRSSAGEGLVAGGIEYGNVKHSMNPFDEIAVEEALRVRETLRKQHGDLAVEIVAVSCGPRAASETLRTALAMGADRAIHIDLEGGEQKHCAEIQNQPLPLAVAKLLRAVVERERPQLILLGKQAIDDDSNATGQMLAGLLNCPQATFASKVELQLDRKVVAVTREIDGGLERIECALPAVITTDLRLNEPRYATLPNIMKAKSKPLTVETPATLGVADVVATTNGRVRFRSIVEPPKRTPGVRVETVDELISKLRSEAGVL